MLLVTGGAGYIGSHFIRTFRALNPGTEVLVVDNLCEGHKESLDGISSLHYEREDIGNVEAMKKLISQYGITELMHFAASCYVNESQSNPTKYFQNNVVKTLNLLKAMDESRVYRLVFSSTCATYGMPVTVPIDENHQQKPINIYGLTKLMIEQTLAGYASVSDWSYTNLRYFNAAGADDEGQIGESHDPETHLIPLVLKAAKGETDYVQVFGTDYDTPDGTCIRDYIHVTDLAVAHCKALDRVRVEKVADSINLGTTYGASVKEVINVCEEITGKKIPVKLSERRAGDPSRLVANAGKAQRMLGWRAERNLESIVASAWRWETNRRY